MVKTSWEAATACSAGLLTIFGAAGGGEVRPRNNKGERDVGRVKDKGILKEFDIFFIRKLTPPPQKKEVNFG